MNHSDPKALEEAQKVIYSYVEPGDRKKHTRKDGTIVYTWQSIGWVVDRSLCSEVANAVAGHYRIVIENQTWGNQTRED